MGKKLYCSPDQKLCGVCSGIADYLNLDASLVRIIAVMIAVYTAVVPTLICYLIMALIIPKAPEDYYRYVNNTSVRLTRSKNKMLFGVCAGIAEAYGKDKTIVRLIFLLCFVCLGFGLFAYIAAAIIMPKADDFTYDNAPNSHY